MRVARQTLALQDAATSKPLKSFKTLKELQDTSAKAEVSNVSCCATSCTVAAAQEALGGEHIHLQQLGTGQSKEAERSRLRAVAIAIVARALPALQPAAQAVAATSLKPDSPGPGIPASVSMT